MIIPLYGFLSGDSLGLLVFGEEEDTMMTLAQKLQQSAKIRIPPAKKFKVLFQGQEISLQEKLPASPLRALDRFDVVHIKDEVEVEDEDEDEDENMMEQ